MSFGHCIAWCSWACYQRVTYLSFWTTGVWKKKNKYSLSSLMYCLGALDQDAQNGPFAPVEQLSGQQWKTVVALGNPQTCRCLEYMQRCEYEAGSCKKSVYMITWWGYGQKEGEHRTDLFMAFKWHWHLLEIILDVEFLLTYILCNNINCPLYRKI